MNNNFVIKYLFTVKVHFVKLAAMSLEFNFSDFS